MNVGIDRTFSVIAIHFDTARYEELRKEYSGKELFSQLLAIAEIIPGGDVITAIGATGRGAGNITAALYAIQETVTESLMVRAGDGGVWKQNATDQPVCAVDTPPQEAAPANSAASDCSFSDTVVSEDVESVVQREYRLLAEHKTDAPVNTIIEKLSGTGLRETQTGCVRTQHILDVLAKVSPKAPHPVVVREYGLDPVFALLLGEHPRNVCRYGHTPLPALPRFLVVDLDSFRSLLVDCCEQPLKANATDQPVCVADTPPQEAAPANSAASEGSAAGMAAVSDIAGQVHDPGNSADDSDSFVFAIEAATHDFRVDANYAVKLELVFSPKERMLYKSRIVYMNQCDRGADDMTGVVACHDGETARTRTAALIKLIRDIIHRWPVLPENMSVVDLQQNAPDQPVCAVDTPLQEPVV